MLLHLPPELIQLVLENVGTPDYLQVAHSCHVLYELASTCREVVLHHLYQTPGLVEGVQELETKRLFQLLSRRSRQQLYGAQFHARCKVFEFDSQVIDVQASSFAPSSRYTNLALVFKGLQDIFLFYAGNGGILHPRAQWYLPWEHPGAVEVLRTAAPREDGVFALYRFMPAMDGDDPNAQHPFVQQALQLNPSGTVYLIHYGSDFTFPCVRICSFPDHAEYEPLSIAVADRETFAISWRHEREDNNHEVVMYNIYDEEPGGSSDVIEVIYECCVLVDAGSRATDRSQNLRSMLDGGYLAHEQGPARDIVFNDSSTQILYYNRAQTLYGSFQRIDMSAFPDSLELKLYRNSCVVPFSDSLSLHFAIDIPFFGTHRTLNQNGRDMCNWKYLSLGIAMHRIENWGVACLLRSEALCQSVNCGHTLNLDRGRRFTDWTVVATLSGFQESTSSIGSITIASRRGTRIAVANWDTVYIWALEPASLIEDNADGFYPEASRAADSGVVELRPIAIPLDAVCFKLMFLDKEDELLALTDRGLMHWDLGPLGKGERETIQLDI